MIRKLLFLATWIVVGGTIAIAANAMPVQQSTNPNDPYYCPPGAKYCPVPGRDNTHFLDTHFGVDAATGQVTRYEGNVHPDEVANSLSTKEEVILTMPTISVENRYNPNPASPLPPQTVQPVYGQPQNPAQYAQPVYQQQPQQYSPYQPNPQQQQQTRVATRQGVSPARIKTSEVADQQVVRQIDTKNSTGEDKRVPWWKGGMWRNRKSNDNDDDDTPSRSSRSSSNDNTPPPVSPDDMWGDEDEFTGYNPDGSVATGAMGSQGGYQQNNPYQDPYQTYQDPFAQPPQAYAGVTNDPSGTSGFVGDSYTLPGSPPPTSPYNNGYVYPGTSYSQESMNNFGPNAYPQPSAPMQTTMSPSYGDPYAAPMPAQPVMSAPPAPIPTQAQPPASNGQRGSAQFENAVNMVKNNRFAEAKSLLLSETSASPNNPAVWRWLGDAQYNLLELQDAIDSYQSALRLDPNDYYALRGQGFAYLHRGHELWRKMMEELNLSQRDQAAATFAQAHENYRQSLAKLGDCLRRAPNDSEAVYGEAMAAEGASRKLYSNAISYIKLGPENRERAELFAENCIQVINKGVERAGERARQNPGESGPRALLGGLYLRKAMLYQQLGRNELALQELRNSHGVQKSILDEIDKNNQTAQKGVADCEAYWKQWGGQGQL